jgi:hypothetical protein
MSKMVKPSGERYLYNEVKAILQEARQSATVV